MLNLNDKFKKSFNNIEQWLKNNTEGGNKMNMYDLIEKSTHALITGNKAKLHTLREFRNFISHNNDIAQASEKLVSEVDQVIATFKKVLESL